MNSGGYPHGTSKMNREDTDVVVQAIDRLGNKVGSQVSTRPRHLLLIHSQWPHADSNTYWNQTPAVEPVCPA